MLSCTHILLDLFGLSVQGLGFKGPLCAQVRLLHMSGTCHAIEMRLSERGTQLAVI